MKLKSIALAATLAASSIPALAITANLGTLGTGSEGFGNFFPLGAPVFSDSFWFSLDSALTVNGLSGSSGISTMGLVLKDSGGDTVAMDLTPASFTFALGAGRYELNFVGFGAGPSSFYGGVVSTAPIPEPETYALMLAGLGVIGFIGARRRERS